MDGRTDEQQTRGSDPNWQKIWNNDMLVIFCEFIRSFMRIWRHFHIKLPWPKPLTSAWWRVIEWTYRQTDGQTKSQNSHLTEHLKQLYACDTLCEVAWGSDMNFTTKSAWPYRIDIGKWSEYRQISSTTPRCLPDIKKIPFSKSTASHHLADSSYKTKNNYYLHDRR